MSNDGQGGYYYQPSLGGRPPSSRVWPALIGAGMVVAVILVLLIALQLTDGDDESSSPSSAAPTSTVEADDVAATSGAQEPSDASEAASPTTAAPAQAAPAASTAAPALDEDGNCVSYSVNETLPAKLCDRGPLVEEIQVALDEADFPLSTDGLFGQKTAAAVRGFQTLNGLESTGVVDQATFDALPQVNTEPDG